jgi:hypothetical protein
MHLWGVALATHGDDPPFADHRDLYATIDQTPIGDVNWESFSLKYNADSGIEGDRAPWMDASYAVWFRDPHAVVRNMLGNPDFKNEMDYVPYREWKGEGDDAKCQWRNLMSGDWVWDRAVGFTGISESQVSYLIIHRMRLRKIPIHVAQRLCL